MTESGLVGLHAAEVISALLQVHPEIKTLSLFVPNPVPLAQERLMIDGASSEIVSKALQLREAYHTPFWDAALLSCLGRGQAATAVLNQARFHNCATRRTVHIDATRWCAPEWMRLLSEVADGEMLVFSSRVVLHDEEIRHIPMLDFHCPVSPENEDLAGSIIDLLDTSGGFLLNSGDSYHFYGKALFDEKMLVGFLARALLLAPIIDRAWIAHQLIERACGLRISRKADGGSEPIIVRVL
jgi:hypothetical protein